MPISLWILHLIKNTAADTSIEEAGRVKERGIRRKEKVRWGAKGKALMLYEKELELNWRNNSFQTTEEKDYGILGVNTYIFKSVHT